MAQNIKKTDPDKRFRRVMSASSLSGDRIRNKVGDDLGKVDEIMIDVPLADKRLGLLINFNVALIKDGITRIANGMSD